MRKGKYTAYVMRNTPHKHSSSLITLINIAGLRECATALLFDSSTNEAYFYLQNQF